MWQTKKEIPYTGDIITKKKPKGVPIVFEKTYFFLKTETRPFTWKLWSILGTHKKYTRILPDARANLVKIVIKLKTPTVIRLNHKMFEKTNYLQNFKNPLLTNANTIIKLWQTIEL